MLIAGSKRFWRTCTALDSDCCGCMCWLCGATKLGRLGLCQERLTLQRGMLMLPAMLRISSRIRTSTSLAHR